MFDRIAIGQEPNDGQGDSARVAGGKINDFMAGAEVALQTLGQRVAQLAGAIPRFASVDAVIAGEAEGEAVDPAGVKAAIDARLSTNLSLAGNLGVGTAAPDARLTVHGESNTFFAGNPSLVTISDAGPAAQGVGGGIHFAGMWGSAPWQSTVLGGIAGVKENSVEGDYGGSLVFAARSNLSASAAMEKWRITSGGSFLPYLDGTQNVGSPSRRGGTAYFATGTINTSDAAEKTPVRLMGEAEVAAARQLAGEIGVFQFLSSVAAKGDGARLHIGMTVQRAIEIMEANGLDPWRYGFICSDPVTRRVTVARTERVPVIDEVEETVAEIEIRNGDAVQVKRTRTVKRPRIDMVPVVDERGQPVMATAGGMSTGEPLLHPVPVTVEREVEVEVDEPAGDLLGFRYDQLAMFVLRGLAARLNEIEAA